MRVNIIAPGNDPVGAPPGCVLTVTRYAGQNPGGPTTAEIAAQGPAVGLWELTAWLGYRIEVFTDNDAPVWWGHIEEVTVNYGNIAVGRTIADVRNRIAVAYTTERVGGQVESKQTTWAEDTDSIALYGQRELLLSRSNLSYTQAIYKRDRALAELAKPRWISRLGLGEPGGAIVRCRGFWSSYGWTFYSQAAGLEAHDSGTSSEQPLGLGFTSAYVGFDDVNDALHQLYGRVKNLKSGYWLRIAGSASNNGSYAVQSGTSQDAVVYTASTISFENLGSDEGKIADSANGLAHIDANDLIQISGAASGANNRFAFVKSGTNDGSEIIIDDGGVSLVDAAAGASITIRRANSIRLDAALTRELAGSTVSVYVYGQKIAQSFTLSVNTSWTVAEIYIRIKKVGAPTGNVSVQLCANSAGAPGTVLDSATLAAADITTQGGWHKFTFSNTRLINYGSVYWIVISRNDAMDSDNYYTVDVSEELGYSGGSLLVYDGAAWQTRSPDADLFFRILGAWQTTKQIREVVTASGWNIEGLDMPIDSGIESNQYRSGSATAQEELVDLLESGTNQNRTLTALIGYDRHLHIQQTDNAQPGDDWVYTVEGRILLPSGAPVDEGVLPVGKWLTLDGAPEILDSLGAQRSILCVRAEYDAISGTLTIDPDASDKWDVGGIADG